MYAYKMTVLKIALHKISNTVWNTHKIHKTHYSELFYNLQVHSAARTGIFLFWNRELDILGGCVGGWVIICFCDCVFVSLSVSSLKGKRIELWTLNLGRHTVHALTSRSRGHIVIKYSDGMGMRVDMTVWLMDHVVLLLQVLWSGTLSHWEYWLVRDFLM